MEPKKQNHKLNSIDWGELLEIYASHCSSELARERVAETAPLKSETEARNSFAEIRSCEDRLAQQSRPIFEGLDLSISWLPRVEKSALLKPLELKDIRLFLEEIDTTSSFLQTVEDELGELSLMESGLLLSTLEQVIAPTGEIRSDASEKLRQLHSERKQLTQDLEKSLDRLVKENELDPVLQDRYVTNREGRLVVPVKSGMRHDLPGIIHGRSTTKQTVFVEPEAAVPMNNRLKQVEIEIEEEVERILRTLSNELHLHYSDFKSSQELMIHIDLRLSQAQVSRKLRAHPVQFSDESFRLENLKHPLLAMEESGVVSNDIELSFDKPALILSGPNAGGKTVLLKSIGLAAQMARCGLPACASPSSKVPFLENILISVGDHQSVDQQLSTFAAHLKDLNDCLSVTGPQNLLLIDEICGSTDPEEGGALAKSFVTRYAANGAFTVLTSHLGPLKTGWAEDSGVVTGCLEYDENTAKPTYRFIPGVAGKSLAIQTARQAGIDAQVIKDALSYMSLESKERLSEDESLQKQKDEVKSLEKKYRQALKEAEASKQAFDKKLREIEEESEKRIEENVKAKQKEIDSLVEKANVSHIFRKHEEVQSLKRSLPRVVKSSSSSEPKSPEEFAKKFPKGSSVFLPTLQRNAVVQSEPNAKGEVTVQSDSMRLQVAWDQIESPNGTVKKKDKTKSFSLSHRVEYSEPVLDLRGKRVEEAIEHLEVELDSAAHKSLDRIKVIHGHGTEALKKAVRSHLSRSTYVSSWQVGTHDGGDGVTWVKLES